MDKRLILFKFDYTAINNDEAYLFLNNNHIKCERKCGINYGLFYNGEIVSIMSFVLKGENRQYELIQYCNKLNINIVDGDVALFKFALSELNPSKIIYNSDRRFPQNDFIHNLNFKIVSKTKPNYFYVIGNERKNRFLYRKSELIRKYNCPNEISEHDFCLSKKWYRIYDCGCLCYEWVNKQF